MFFRFNGIQLGANSNQKLHIESPITGLEKAPIRISYNNYSGRDGGYVSSQFYSPREITISGFYIASSCEEADEIRYSLKQALPIRQSIDLFISNFSGDMYYTEAYLRDFKMDITNPTSGRYQITFVCPDHLLYDAGDGVDPDSGYVEYTFYKAVPGGYITPYSLPVTWVAGTTGTVVTNDSDLAIYPEITLEGQFTNPRISNETTGKFIELNMTTTSGDIIKINMKNRTITLNGSSVAANRTSDSSWWPLEVGDNSIILYTDSGSDDTEGTIKYRVGYEGI